VAPFTRKLFVKHRTEFTYAGGGASESVNEIRLRPLDGPRQQVVDSRLTVSPAADVAEFEDPWGNRVSWCQIVELHERLAIEVEALVLVGGQPIGDPGSTGSWATLAAERYRESLADFVLPSQLVAWSDATRRFAHAVDVAESTSVAEWARNIARNVHARLVYERGATDVTTTVDDVIAAGRGVCQDFAHVFVALCRMRGVAARYVSGWLFEPDRDGPVESHAWAEVFVPGVGWIEEDPTHAGPVDDRYIRIAAGRDYADVVPIKGTYLGGHTESMRVAVELLDVSADARDAEQVVTRT
jgi:transglutaminase-like putative cysteine protease